MDIVSRTFMNRSNIKGKMLAQILPGFRDFRTPLVTGSLWMIFFWLISGMQVPSEEVKTGPMGLVNSLGDYFSPALLAGTLSFTAYVIGIILALDSKQATYLVSRISMWGMNRGFRFKTDEEMRKGLHTWRYRQRRVAERRKTPLLHMLIFESMERSLDPQKYPRGSTKWADTESGLILRLEGEIPLLGTKLLEKNKELYDIFDRTRSEADFRLGISLPIVAISIQQSIAAFNNYEPQAGLVVLFAGMITTGILLIKGWNKVRESSGTVLSMVHIGVIKSDILEQFEYLHQTTEQSF